MRTFTDEQKKLLLDMIEAWKARLRLQHWTFCVEWDQPANEGAILSIRVVEGRHVAMIRVGTFFDQPPSDQQNAVCHELIHCIIEPLWYEVDCLALNTLRSEEYGRIIGVLQRHMERAVDHLAGVLAPIE